ncbi:hypothetical protein D3C84_1177130 [compost metagenome]
MIHGPIEDVGHQDVLRQNQEPLGIYQRSLQQLKTCSEPPETVANQRRASVDVSEPGLIGLKPLWRFQRALKKQRARHQHVLEPPFKQLGLGIVQ